MLNRKAFFDAVRQAPFPGRLSQGQVDGMNAILSEWDARGLTDLRHLAYMLATAFHETARKMQPINEYGGAAYFRRMYDIRGSRPHVARSLGNTVPGDGVKFHGRGYVQLTGRANYRKASQKLGVDFIADPDRVMEPRLAATIMFVGMEEGWFTGKKLSDYINDRRVDYRNARRIINGLDRASTIAGYAEAFHGALMKAAVAGTPTQPRKPLTLPDDQPPTDKPKPDSSLTGAPAQVAFALVVLVVIAVGLKAFGVI
ncbi:glycoside hydrolase family 19 protein [Bauldia sp.]|uniref:glycoside hydrolase family 19 protein n=1 Tax=Bauldia sp. TaxID=2575872 RepID=UPI003BA9738D